MCNNIDHVCIDPIPITRVTSRHVTLLPHCVTLQLTSHRRYQMVLESRELKCFKIFNSLLQRNNRLFNILGEKEVIFYRLTASHGREQFFILYMRR